jgi:hypothetical protein
MASRRIGHAKALAMAALVVAVAGVASGCGGVSQATSAIPTPTPTPTPTSVTVNDLQVRQVCTGATPQELPAALPGPSTSLLPDGVTTMVMCTRPGWDDGFRPQVAYVVSDDAQVALIANGFNALTATPGPNPCSATSGAYRAVFFSAIAEPVALLVEPSCSTVSNTTITRSNPQAPDALAKAAVGVPGTRTVALYPAAAPTSTP